MKSREEIDKEIERCKREINKYGQFDNDPYAKYIVQMQERIHILEWVLSD